MAKGYFDITDNLNDKNDFIISPIEIADNEKIPQEQLDFVFSIEKTLDVITNLYLQKLQNEKTFTIYFHQLKNLAKLGLWGKDSQCEIAKKGLELYKEEILTNEAGKIKNAYIKKLGKSAFSLGIIPLLIGIALDFTFCYKNTIICSYCMITKNLLFLWAGAMLGVWLSFTISKTTITFEDLVLVEKDHLEPLFRLFFVGGLSIIFGLLIIKKVFVLKLGGF
jgi:hypothetical protein